MRRTRTVACPSCGARWGADRARFCGWCGLPLRRPDPSVDTDPPSRRWPRRVAWAAAAVGGVAALVAVALLVDGLRLPRAADPAVELADDGDAVVPQGEPLTADERAALLAPFDPNRLRCEPRGCEVWRRDLVDRQGRHTLVAPMGDLVLVSIGNDIDAFDAATGEPRWQQRWPASASAPASANWTTILPTGDGEVVVLARPERGHLLALRRDGSVAWRDDGADQVHNLLVAGDSLLTSAAAGPVEPGAVGETGASTEYVVARDLSSGAVRWERTVTALMHASERVALANDGGDVVVLDLGSGDELARRALGPDPWLYPVGDVLISFGPEDQQALLSTDLQPLPDLAGLSELYPLPDTEHVLALRRGAAAAEPTPDRLFLVGSDGRVRWSIDLDTAPGTALLCCPQPQVRDGAVLLLPSLGDAQGVVARSLADGAPIDLPADDVPLGNGVWWVAPDTALEQRGDRVVLHHDGRRVEVSGQDSWPVNHAPPFVFTNGRSLLGVRLAPDG